MRCQLAFCLQLQDELSTELGGGQLGDKLVQNCMLQTQITMTSKKLCLLLGRVLKLPIPGSPVS